MERPGLNTIIGKILAYPTVKPVVSSSTHVVSFFNGSHYWGGQLVQQAQSQSVTQNLKTNTELQWYALILQSLSFQNHQYVNS